VPLFIEYIEVWNFVFPSLDFSFFFAFGFHYSERFRRMEHLLPSQAKHSGILGSRGSIRNPRAELVPCLLPGDFGQCPVAHDKRSLALFKYIYIHKLTPENPWLQVPSDI